jgi:serine/threonine protein kinase
MGVVYRARQISVGGREVAVKVIRPDRIAPALIERFRREIEVSGRLEHPNIVRIYDAGESGGVLYLVMEYLEGMTLAQVVKRRGALPVAEACDLVRQAALGLDWAHAQGVLHRDVKPANLFLTTLNEVKLLDFGLARLTGPTSDESLTHPGQGMGTPNYMAPEQAVDAHSVDAGVDLYSLGLTLYHLLTARSPTRREPLRSLCPAVPGELVRLLDNLLVMDPNQRRPATAADLARYLRPFTTCRDSGTLAVPRAERAETLHTVLDVLLWDEREGCYRSITEPGVLQLARQRPDAYRPDVAMTLNNLGTLLADLNALEVARDSYWEALVIRRELAQLRPDVYRPEMAQTLSNLGIVQRDLHG